MNFTSKNTFESEPERLPILIGGKIVGWIETYKLVNGQLTDLKLKDGWESITNEDIKMKVK